MNIFDGFEFTDILLEFPGACFRWVIGNCFGRDKTVMEYFKEDTMANMGWGIFLWAVGLILYGVFKSSS